jgi:hypothetical protein
MKKNIIITIWITVGSYLFTMATSLFVSSVMKCCEMRIDKILLMNLWLCLPFLMLGIGYIIIKIKSKEVAMFYLLFGLVISAIAYVNMIIGINAGLKSWKYTAATLTVAFYPIIIGIGVILFTIIMYLISSLNKDTASSHEENGSL